MYVVPLGVLPIDFFLLVVGSSGVSSLQKLEGRLNSSFPIVIAMKCSRLKNICCLLILSFIFGYIVAAWSAVYSGDVTRDCTIDLKDPVVALRLLAGIPPDNDLYVDSDINGDGQIGLAEAIYAMQVVAYDLPTSLDCIEWDETAVRKVLQTFAYGGHPTDSQITLWAEMAPGQAIDEIMTFDLINLKLSPPDFDNLHTNSDGTLEGLADLWSSESPENQTPENRRRYFDKRAWSGPRYNWLMAIRARGLNPFVHRIGFWETNYHMAVNQDVGIYPFPIIRHYDNIVGALSDSKSYQQVMAQGAVNAAVAYQYGHNHNVFIDGIFRGNDDFAREFHQLFFGILGEGEHEYHESVSIENTARALTGIRANYHPSEEGGPDVEVYFSEDVHHTDPLEILHASIVGPTAKEKITNLAEVAIEHSESRNNLPVMIVGILADDNLTPEKITTIQKIWNDLQSKDLLEFLKQYATSSAFHSADRIKYQSSFDKHLFIANQMQLSNIELYEEFHNVANLLGEDGVTPFYPIHNVFGHQSGAEAFNSPTIFKNNYNTSTEGYGYYDRVEKSGVTYRKEWKDIIPRSEGGLFKAKDVAKWLWQRFITDGWKNYTTLEQAHLCALLTAGRDIGYVLWDSLDSEPHPDTVYFSSDFEDSGSEIGQLFSQLGETSLNLDHTDEGERKLANRYIQRAIGFIAATPFTALQEGR